jgi:PadR family transcriptional regulator PadR
MEITGSCEVSFRNTTEQRPIIQKNLKSEDMNIENTQSQMRKGILEFCILSIIRRGEAYPSDIVDEMKAANLHILEGTLYPLLTRLKNADMLTYRWVESNSGPPRKYFSLTPKGETFYQELEATWQELANAVNKLTRMDEPMTNRETINQPVAETALEQPAEPTPAPDNNQNFNQ